MSRIIFPTDFAAQKKLLENIIAKHTQDGANSLLTAYLPQQQIDLDDCLTKANAADTFNDQQFNTHQQSEKNNELKGFKSEVAIKNLKNEVQFLKKLFVSNPRQLTDWGIRVIGNNRIQYPQNFNALANMALTFFDKHLSFAAGSSPLQAFIQRNHIDVAEDKTAIEDAILLKDKADTQAEQAASFTQQRNVLWQPVIKTMKEIGDYLKSIHTNTLYSLGDYGFLIADTKRKHRIVTTKILLGQSKTLKGLVIGSELVNKGPVTLVLYKGTKTAAQSITVLPGQTISIPKGFSTITVVNEDITQTAVFSAQRIV